MEDTGIITTYASGENLIVKWNIENFFTLSEEDGEMYISPDFSFGGAVWYLRIRPISTYESGVDVVFEWNIENFFNLLETGGAWYDSSYFSFGGESWWLRIYPNGSSGSDSSGHVDLDLCKNGSGHSIKQTFSLSLKTAEGEIYNKQNVTKDFEEWLDYHSFNRFIQRSDLTRRRYELVPDGVLTVVCTMKSSTSAGSASNTASASDKCCHCKITFNADSLSSHQKKCMHRPIKCPDCLEVVVLQTWLDEHECQEERPEAEKEHKENSENAGVNASTQTEEDSEACASGSSISSHEKKLHDDLKNLFLKKEDCDIIIKVKGSEIPTHRVILKARSPVFASTFQHNMKENATGVVEIEDSDPSPFMDFLNFLYCGDIGMISQENVFDLFRLADKYEVLDLKATCLEFMKKNITVDTFCETITLALQYSEAELIALTTDFFVRNAEEILQTIKWQTFAAENPTQSNELTIKLVKWFKHSNA